MTSFTGPGGHPVEIVDQFIQFHILPGTWKPDYDEQAMFVVRNEADIDERFALLLKQKPAAVKAFLLYSDRYAGNLTKPETRGNQRGMDPKLLPYLVRKAHSASLKVIVHIYSTADLRNALAAGVDEIAHFPGTGYRSDMPVQDFQITAADAAAVAKAGTPITTTLSWLADMKDDDPEHYQTARDEVVIPNFKLLKNAGVQFLVGSDKFRRDVLPELDLLSSLGMYSNRELLRMDVDATARAIFPGRKIGRLQDGYEASFLVLSRNPEDSLDNLKSITLRVKQGRELRPLQLAIDRPNPDCVEGPPC